MSQFARDLEKKITGKLNGIKNGTVDVKGSGVNDLIKKLKGVDEAAAEKLQKSYIEAVKSANEKNGKK
jgi:hypothetical protein